MKRHTITISESTGKEKTQFSRMFIVHRNIFHPEGGDTRPLSHPSAKVKPSLVLSLLDV
jgi:hypothetical protein